MKKPKSFKPRILGTGKKQFSNKKPRQYDTQDWVEYRFRFLQANPKCYCCDSRSTVVDHVISHKGDDKLFWNETNYIPLCKPHHDYITGKFDRHNPPMTKEKLQYLQAERMTYMVSRKVIVVPLPLKS